MTRPYVTLLLFYFYCREQRNLGGKETIQSRFDVGPIDRTEQTWEPFRRSRFFGHGAEQPKGERLRCEVRTSWVRTRSRKNAHPLFSARSHLLSSSPDHIRPTAPATSRDSAIRPLPHTPAKCDGRQNRKRPLRLPDLRHRLHNVRNLTSVPTSAARRSRSVASRGVVRRER